MLLILRDTPPKGERTLAQAGHTQDVLNMRKRFQEVMQPEAVELVEGLTGRRVIGFMSENHIDPDLGAEVFVLEPADEPGQLEEAESTDAQG
ncbi:MAG: DUF2294 family protein [Thermoleophilaceae bacterium]|nr:DUF2294 family protein [Thermoleophilaceae bacterium]